MVMNMVVMWAWNYMDSYSYRYLHMELHGTIFPQLPPCGYGITWIQKIWNYHGITWMGECFQVPCFPQLSPCIHAIIWNQVSPNLNDKVNLSL